MVLRTANSEEIPKTLGHYIEDYIPLFLEFLAAQSTSHSLLVKLSTCPNCHGSVLPVGIK